MGSCLSHPSPIVVLTASSKEYSLPSVQIQTTTTEKHRSSQVICHRQTEKPQRPPRRSHHPFSKQHVSSPRSRDRDRDRDPSRRKYEPKRKRKRKRGEVHPLSPEASRQRMGPRDVVSVSDGSLQHRLERNQEPTKQRKLGSKQDSSTKRVSGEHRHRFSHRTKKTAPPTSASPFSHESDIPSLSSSGTENSFFPKEKGEGRVSSSWSFVQPKRTERKKKQTPSTIESSESHSDQSMYASFITLTCIDEFYHFYDVVKKLAQGSFGIVHMVQCKDTHEIFAAKITKCLRSSATAKKPSPPPQREGPPSKQPKGPVLFTSPSQQEFQRLKNEVEIHRSLSHPSIVRVREAFYTTSKTMEGLVTVMELANQGSLRHYLHCRRDHGLSSSLEEKDVQWIIFQVLQGLVYLHEEKGMLHRDIKPENLLLHSPSPPSLISPAMSNHPSPRNNKGHIPAPPTNGNGEASHRLVERSPGVPSAVVHAVSNPETDSEHFCSSVSFFRERVRVWIADFGFTKLHSNHTKSFCGSLAYIAPEILLARRPVSHVTSGPDRPQISVSPRLQTLPLSRSASRRPPDKHVIRDPSLVGPPLKQPFSERRNEPRSVLSPSSDPVPQEPQWIEHRRVEEEELRVLVPFKKRVSYTPKCDVWSVGIVCFELLYGYNPSVLRKRDHATTHMRKVASRRFLFREAERCPGGKESFLKHLLQHDPERRFSASEALAHPWMQSVAKQWNDRWIEWEEENSSTSSLPESL